MSPQLLPTQNTPVQKPIYDIVPAPSTPQVVVPPSVVANTPTQLPTCLLTPRVTALEQWKTEHTTKHTQIDQQISDIMKITANISASCDKLSQAISAIPEGKQGPVGPEGKRGPIGSDGKQGLAGKSADPIDVKALALQVAELLKPQQPPTPEHVASWSHLVLVADRRGEYWAQLYSQFTTASQYYHQIKQVDPPEDANIGPLPVLVAYQGGVPAKTFVGLRAVETALSAISRGEFDSFLF